MDALTAMKQALEALENGKKVRNCEGGTKYQPPLENVAISNLRTVIAENAVSPAPTFRDRRPQDDEGMDCVDQD